MQTANFTIDDLVSSGDFSLAYEIRKDSTLENVTYSKLYGMAPAGGINANASELANWLLFNLNKGSFGGKQVVSESRMQDMLTPMMPIPQSIVQAPEIKGMGYCLGWEAECFRGKTLIYHGGNVSGSSAMIGFMPEINAGLAILVNTGTSMLAYSAMYSLFDTLLGFEGKKDWAKELTDGIAKLYAAMDQGPQTTGKSRKLTARDLEEFTGTYYNKAFGTVIIRTGPTGLTIRMAERNASLENVHYDIFKSELDIDFIAIPYFISFISGLDGKISSLELDFSGSVAVFSKKG
jgi:hypothetical protein